MERNLQYQEGYIEAASFPQPFSFSSQHSHTSLQLNQTYFTQPTTPKTKTIKPHSKCLEHTSQLVCLQRPIHLLRTLLTHPQSTTDSRRTVLQIRESELVVRCHFYISSRSAQELTRVQNSLRERLIPLRLVRREDTLLVLAEVLRRTPLHLATPVVARRVVCYPSNSVRLSRGYIN